MAVAAILNCRTINDSKALREKLTASFEISRRFISMHGLPGTSKAGQLEEKQRKTVAGEAMALCVVQAR